jgi:hypothetical protein
LVREQSPVRGSAAANGGANNQVDALLARFDYRSRSFMISDRHWHFFRATRIEVSCPDR